MERRNHGHVGASLYNPNSIAGAFLMYDSRSGKYKFVPGESITDQGAGLSNPQRLVSQFNEMATWQPSGSPTQSQTIRLAENGSTWDFFKRASSTDKSDKPYVLKYVPPPPPPVTVKYYNPQYNYSYSGVCRT